MRYFKIYDEITPEGDVYRWNGNQFQMSGNKGWTWGYEHGPTNGETPEEYLTFLAGPNGRWEEVDNPYS